MFADLKLTCARFGCSQPPIACVASLGLGISDNIRWLVTGFCQQHESKFTAEAERMHAEVTANKHQRTARHADLASALDWIHAISDRCAVAYFSVATPSIP